MELLTLVPPLITGVLGFLSAWLLQRRNGRRVRLAHQVSVENLVRRDVPLEVSYAGKELQQPQLLTATFRNLGPRDIEVDDFQGGGIALTVTEARIVAPTDCTVGDEPVAVTVDHDTGRIVIPAMLIPTNAVIRLRILAADRPATAAATVRLRQVTAVGWENQGLRLGPSRLSLFATSLLGVLVSVVSFLTTTPDAQLPVWVQENGVAFTAAAVGLAAVVSEGMFRVIRYFMFSSVMAR